MAVYALKGSISHEPKESKTTIFPKFGEKLMALQNPLDRTYHTDQLLRVRLLTAIDVPPIE